MEHLKIWIQLITLIVGCGVLFDTLGMRRRLRHGFLGPLWRCYLFLNLCFLAGVLSEYLLVNLFDDKFGFKASVYGEIIGPFAGVFFVGLVYNLFAVGRSLRGHGRSRVLRGLFLGLAVFSLLRGVVGLTTGRETLIHRVIAGTHTVLQIVLFLLACLVLAWFIIGGGRRDNNESITTRAFRWFGVFYLGGCGLILASAVFFGPAHGVIHSLIYLAFNLFPFVWYRRWLEDESCGPDGVADGVASGEKLNRICAEYGISERQQEIIELLLQGKSNPDIAEALYISPNTVKNHLYKLYQKLGVKSRFELIGFFLERGK